VAAAVDAKVEAHEVKASPEGEGAAASGPARGAQVIDLAEMLQRSLGGRSSRVPRAANEGGDSEEATEATETRPRAATKSREARAPRESAAPRRGPKKASAVARAQPPKRRRAS
jgi:hypothetical protein